jgi:hypothetical protein
LDVITRDPHIPSKQYTLFTSSFGLEKALSEPVTCIFILQGKVELLRRLLTETVGGMNAHRVALANGHNRFALVVEELALLPGEVEVSQNTFLVN